MCYILTAIKLKESQEAKDVILNVLAEQQVGNSHGSASVAFNFDKRVPSIVRAMEIDIENMIETVESDVFSYHFRLATIGGKTVNNVHYWKKGNWAFAHNGQIHGLTNEDDDSDSLTFFKNIVSKGYLTKGNKAKCAKIKEYTNKVNFWGRYIIVNLKTKNVYFFGDFETYLVENSYLVITSVTTSFEKNINILGLPFGGDDEVKALASEIDGVWMFDYKMRRFMQVFETLKDYTTPYKGTGTAVAKQDDLGWRKVLSGKKKEKANETAPRTDESFIKEFANRMKKEMQEHPDVQALIESELQYHVINIWGRTETEEIYWSKWIAPQLEKLERANIKYREVDFSKIMTETYE